MQINLSSLTILYLDGHDYGILQAAILNVSEINFASLQSVQNGPGLDSAKGLLVVHINEA